MIKLNTAKVISLLFFLLFLVSSVQAESNYLGDYCWSSDWESGGVAITKLGIFDLGGNHYQLLGTNQTPDDGTYIARGNMEIVNGKFHFSILMIDGNNDALSSIQMLCIVEPSTLNGSCNMLISGANEIGSEIRHETIEITHTSCR